MYDAIRNNTVVSTHLGQVGVSAVNVSTPVVRVVAFFVVLEIQKLVWKHFPDYRFIILLYIISVSYVSFKHFISFRAFYLNHIIFIIAVILKTMLVFQCKKKKNKLKQMNQNFFRNLFKYNVIYQIRLNHVDSKFSVF